MLLLRLTPEMTMATQPLTWILLRSCLIKVERTYSVLQMTLLAVPENQYAVFSCPEIGPIFLKRGTYKVVVRDFNGATITDAQCNGGAYSLSVTGRVKRLRLVKDDKNVILDAVTEENALGELMVQTTSEVKRSSIKQQEILLEER